MVVFDHLYTSAALFLCNRAPLTIEKGANCAPIMYITLDTCGVRKRGQNYVTSGTLCFCYIKFCI